MKIEKLDINGKKQPIEILDKVFSAKINKKLVNSILYKTKFLVQPQKYTLKKELETLDMLAEKHQYLLVVVWLMVQKVNYHIKREN